MIFTKKDFNFLDLYVTISDVKTILSDKFQIKIDKKNNRIVFSQFSMNASAITIIKKDIDPKEEEFQCIFSSGSFNQMIKLIGDDVPIEITKNQVTFGDAKYEFKSIDAVFPDVDITINRIETNQKTNVTKIVDLNKMSHLKFCIGADLIGLDTVYLTNGYFTASNKVDVAGAVKTNNSPDISLYFPRIMVDIMSGYKITEIDLINMDNTDDDEDKGYSNFSYFVLGNSYIILSKKEYILPNLFDEGIKDSYNHTYKAVVMKNDIIKKLYRIAIVSQENLFSRIFLSFKINELIIESKDNGYGIEKISMTIDKEIQGRNLILSAKFLSQILDQFTDKEEISIYIPTDNEGIAIMIKSNLDDKFYIHMIYTDYELEDKIITVDNKDDNETIKMVLNDE